MKKLKMEILDEHLRYNQANPVYGQIVDHQTSTNWNSIEFIFLTFLFLNLAISKLKNKQEN